MVNLVHKLGGFGCSEKDRPYMPVLAPKSLRETFALDRITKNSFRDSDLKVSRSLITKEVYFNSMNLSMFPIPVGSKKIFAIRYSVTDEEGSSIARVGRFNGWLELRYETEEARQKLISLRQQWREYLERRAT